MSYQNRWTTTQSPVFNNPNKSDGTLKETWNVLWDGISRANFFLSMIDKPIMDSTKREQFRAEALFLRSFYYYQLVCAWGDVPLRLNVINNLNQVQIARTPA
ncbi:RagB/SusD family nutrient uptake outer membrane protein, partial [bacterium]|nr:RagB/SusD family nutrient uptake outer membrane protein [bacterium]